MCHDVRRSAPPFAHAITCLNLHSLDPLDLGLDKFGHLLSGIARLSHSRHLHISILCKKNHEELEASQIHVFLFLFFCGSQFVVVETHHREIGRDAVVEWPAFSVKPVKTDQPPRRHPFWTRSL